jgi:hypothetical protein
MRKYVEDDEKCGGRAFNSLWHDDGDAFMCSRCGTVTRRTRANQYPKMRPTPPRLLR